VTKNHVPLRVSIQNFKEVDGEVGDDAQFSRGEVAVILKMSLDHFLL